MKNPWVGYVDRSYKSIRTSIINRLKALVPELQDYSPSNLLITVVDMFAGVGEMINYYIDVTAREFFLPTARRFSSLLREAARVNYLGRARLSAYADVTFTSYDSGVVLNPTTFKIPQGTVLKDSSGNTWTTLNDQEFRAGFNNVSTAAKQQEDPTDYNLLGTSDGSLNQLFELPANYCHDTLEIQVGAADWSRVGLLQFSKPDSLHFQVALKTDGKVYVEFGDNVTGLTPGNGNDIYGKWKTTNGADGQIGSDAIDTIETELVLPSGVDYLTVTNPERSYGGKDIEGIEDLRRAIPLSVYTLQRAVTKPDYEYVAALAPGVRTAFAEFECGPAINLYIIGFEGGVPSTALLAETKQFVEDRAIFSIPIVTKPSGETHLKGAMTIKGTYGASASSIRAEAIKALEGLYSPYAHSPRRSIHMSDIVAVVDNVSLVDFLTLNSFFAQPYLRPSNLSTQLDYNIDILPASNNSYNWKLIYQGGQFALLLEGAFIQTVLAGIQYSGIQNILDIFITAIPGNIQEGDYWDFLTYPYSTDFELVDLSIPVINSTDFTLEIIETVTK